MRTTRCMQGTSPKSTSARLRSWSSARADDANASAPERAIIGKTRDRSTAREKREFGRLGGQRIVSRLTGNCCGGAPNAESRCSRTPRRRYASGSCEIGAGSIAPLPNHCARFERREPIPSSMDFNSTTTWRPTRPRGITTPFLRASFPSSKQRRIHPKKTMTACS